MDVDAEIIDALQVAAEAAVAASSLPDLPIAYIDVNFDPPNDGKFLELVHIPNNRENETWGEEKTYQGMFRLILHWPKDGGGTAAPMTALASISAYFSKSRELGALRITNPPNFTGKLDMPSETLYPSSLRYARFQHS